MHIRILRKHTRVMPSEWRTYSNELEKKISSFESNRTEPIERFGEREKNGVRFSQTF